MESGINALKEPRRYEGVEWPRWMAWVETLVRTEPGRVVLQRFRSSEGMAASQEEAQRLQQETEDAFWLSGESGFWNALRELPAFEEALKSLEKGRVLSVPECAIIRRWVRASEVWRTWTFPKEERPSALVKAVVSLPDLSRWSARLESLLDTTDALSERASETLFRLLTRKRATELEARERVRTLMGSLDAEGVLQERYVDHREGTFVLPVRAQEQGKVEGRIVDSSSSKQTVFIEPESVKQASRMLSELELKIEEEIYRIRVEVTDFLKPAQGLLGFAFGVLVEWDAIAARARAAEELQAVPIQVSARNEWKLKGAVHPLLLLEEKTTEFEPVRNDFEWKGQPILLISGPNTGGKTVWMKTLGLFALFARSGFFATAQGACVVPFFKELLTDVGDSQNLEEHLSSFSGHLKKMREALEHPQDQKLILLDELNSATDPDEGAALAQALLEELSTRSTIVATTHDPRLKAFGVKDTRVLNASVAFDEEEGRPKYQVILGQPGASRAFETARRLGLPEAILIRAGDLISKRTLELNDALSQMELDRKELEKRTQALESREGALSAREQRLRGHLEQEIEKERDAAFSEIRTQYTEFQEQFKNLLKQMTLTRSHDDLRKVREAGEVQMQAAQKQWASHTKEKSAPLKEEGLSFEVGDSVLVRTLRQTGHILMMKGKRVRVQLDRGMQVEVRREDLEFANRAKKRASMHRGVQFEMNHQDALQSTLDLRGERVEAGLERLEAYLNQVKVAGLPSCKIIHGMGTGALKDAVRTYLSEQTWIQRFEEAPLTDGGAGVTWVYL